MYICNSVPLVTLWRGTPTYLTSSYVTCRILQSAPPPKPVMISPAPKTSHRFSIRFICSIPALISLSLSLSHSACFISTSSNCTSQGAIKRVVDRMRWTLRSLWIVHDDDAAGERSSEHDELWMRLSVLLRRFVCLFSRSLHAEIRASSPPCIKSGKWHINETDSVISPRLWGEKHHVALIRDVLLGKHTTV